MLDSPVIVSALCLHCKGKSIINGISFDAAAGEVLALSGPVGAGKTTLIKGLAGLLRPSGGTVRIMGLDPLVSARRVRKLMGVQVHGSSLPGGMRVKEAVTMASAYYGTAPCYDLLEQLGLVDSIQESYRDLSEVEQQLLSLALALGHEPVVAILDEPFTGLDVQSRERFSQVVLKLKERGTAVIMTCRDNTEVKALADRGAVLMSGHITAMGEPEKLPSFNNGPWRIYLRTQRSSLELMDLPYLEGINEACWKDDCLIFYSDNPGSAAASIISLIELYRDCLLDFRIEGPSQENLLERAGELA